jgi:hypothetical protein
MAGVVFKTIQEEFGRLVQHQTVQQQLEQTEPVLSAEEMFDLEQKPFRLAKPVHGPRALGGSIGGSDPVQSHRSIPVVDDGIVLRHQDHEAQGCCHPTCTLCAEPDYQYRDTPMFGRRHEFDPPKPEPVVVPTRLRALADICVQVEGEKSKQYFIGSYPPDQVPLVRHLCCVISPKIRGRYKVYSIPPNQASLVPALTNELRDKLSSKGLI